MPISLDKFDYSHPLSVLVIGAGGTGSQVMMHLGRIHASMLLIGQTGLQVQLLDDDIVSEANMGRQMFSACDIGEYKSKVIIERINRFYGTRWDYGIERFDDAMVIMRPHIVITCVDTVKSRRYVDAIINKEWRYNNHSGYRSDRLLIWIDAGNGKHTGQIVVGCKMHKLPTIFELEPNLEDHESQDKDTPSCSLIEALEKQDLFINTIVAASIGQIMWDIGYRKQLNTAQVYINLERERMVSKITPEKYYEIQNREITNRGDSDQPAVKSRKNAKRSSTRKIRNAPAATG